MCDGSFRTPYIQQAVGGEWGVKDLIGGTVEWAAIQSVTSTWLRRGDDISQYIFTLKMATEMFAETLENFKNSTRLIPESRSCTLNSTNENVRTRIKYEVSSITPQRAPCFRTDLDSLQFQLSFYIPKISARAHYKSSGVLIMVQASGGGDYWGEYGECNSGSGTDNMFSNRDHLFLRTS
jgi:hypothetical protein